MFFFSQEKETANYFIRRNHLYRALRRKIATERSTLISKLVNPTNWIIKFRKSTSKLLWSFHLALVVPFPSNRALCTFIFKWAACIPNAKKNIHIANKLTRHVKNNARKLRDDISYRLFTFELYGTQYQLVFFFLFVVVFFSVFLGRISLCSIF